MSNIEEIDDLKKLEKKAEEVEKEAKDKVREETREQEKVEDDIQVEKHDLRLDSEDNIRVPDESEEK